MCTVVNFGQYGSVAALDRAFGERWLYIGRANRAAPPPFLAVGVTLDVAVKVAAGAVALRPGDQQHEQARPEGSGSARVTVMPVIGSTPTSWQLRRSLATSSLRRNDENLVAFRRSH